MTLFEKLKEIIGLGWSVKFSSFAFQFEVTIEKENINGKIFTKVSSLPLQDHFYEKRIINCIDWSISEIEKEIESNQLIDTIDNIH